MEYFSHSNPGLQRGHHGAVARDVSIGVHAAPCNTRMSRENHTSPAPTLEPTPTPDQWPDQHQPQQLHQPDQHQSALIDAALKQSYWGWLHQDSSRPPTSADQQNYWGWLHQDSSRPPTNDRQQHQLVCLLELEQYVGDLKKVDEHHDLKYNSLLYKNFRILQQLQQSPVCTQELHQLRWRHQSRQHPLDLQDQCLNQPPIDGRQSLFDTTRFYTNNQLDHQVQMADGSLSLVPQPTWQMAARTSDLEGYVDLIEEWVELQDFEYDLLLHETIGILQQLQQSPVCTQQLHQLRKLQLPDQHQLDQQYQSDLLQTDQQMETEWAIETLQQLQQSPVCTQQLHQLHQLQQPGQHQTKLHQQLLSDLLQPDLLQSNQELEAEYAIGILQQLQRPPVCTQQLHQPHQLQQPKSNEDAESDEEARTEWAPKQIAAEWDPVSRHWKLCHAEWGVERRLPVHHSIIKQFGEPILQCMAGYKVPGFDMHTIDTRRYFREPRIEGYQALGDYVVDESDGANAEEAQLEAQRAFGLRIAAPPGQLQCKVCWKSQPLECFARRRRDVYRAHCHSCVARWGSNFSEARSQHHIVFEHQSCTVGGGVHLFDIEIEIEFQSFSI